MSAGRKDPALAFYSVAGDVAEELGLPSALQRTAPSAGYSKNTPAKGLKTYMPEFRRTCRSVDDDYARCSPGRRTRRAMQSPSPVMPRYLPVASHDAFIRRSSILKSPSSMPFTLRIIALGEPPEKADHLAVAALDGDDVWRHGRRPRRAGRDRSPGLRDASSWTRLSRATF